MTDKATAVKILERRLQRLEQTIYEKQECADWRGLSWDRAEASAIRVALRELVER